MHSREISLANNSIYKNRFNLSNLTNFSIIGKPRSVDGFAVVSFQIRGPNESWIILDQFRYCLNREMRFF